MWAGFFRALSLCALDIYVKSWAKFIVFSTDGATNKTNTEPQLWTHQSWMNNIPISLIDVETVRPSIVIRHNKKGIDTRDLF